MHPALYPDTFLGKVLRFPLRALPSDAIVPILSGPNRGLRWIAGAGVHRCWMGTYESVEIGRFLRHVTKESIVWDIGAHTGYFSLACRHAKSVIACEALPRNLDYLRRHIAINGLSNIEVVANAIADQDGTEVLFGGHDSTYQGQIGGAGAPVRTATIDALIARGLPPPTLIKMDIEGGEIAALPGARQTLQCHRPVIMVATHSKEAMDVTPRFLESLGYRTQILFDCVWGLGIK